MKKVVSVEYCTSWGYTGRAVALARTLLNEHENNLGGVNLIPSTGGIYEVKLDDNVIFSKKEAERYPEKDEVEELIRKEIA